MCWPTNNGPSESDLAYQRTDAGWAAQQASWARQRATMSPADQQAFDARNEQYQVQHGVGNYSTGAIAARLRGPNVADANVGAGARAAAIRAATGRGQAWALAQGDGTQLQQGFLGDVTTPASGSVTEGGLPAPNSDGMGTRTGEDISQTPIQFRARRGGF